MTEQEKILDQLTTTFQDLTNRLNGKATGLLHNFHKQSLDKLKATQFPDRKHEDWRYTSVQNLITHAYQLPSQINAFDVPPIPGLETYIIPVINGYILPEWIDQRLIAAGLKIRSLEEMLENEDASLPFTKWITNAPTTGNQAFEFLNFAFQSGGVYIDIPPNLKLDKPIEFRIIHDDPKVTFSHPLYFINAATGSDSTIIERFEKNTLSTHPSSKSLINALGFMYLNGNARISHVRWQDLPAHQHLVYKLSVVQERDSHFETFAFDFGGLTTRNNIKLDLEGSNTFSSLKAAFIAQSNQTIDHQTEINHKVPHCESHETYKGIIDGQATGAFNGKVYVHQDAQKTNAFQQNDTLVLSANARMNSKPQLEIFADDVKCSHGATIGQMDDKALFYLRTRGIDVATATHMLKAAFLAEVLDVTPNEPLANHIRSRMKLDL